MVSLYIVGMVITTLVSVAWMELSDYGGCRNVGDAAGALSVGIMWPATVIAFLVAWAYLSLREQRGE